MRICYSSGSKRDFGIYDVHLLNRVRNILNSEDDIAYNSASMDYAAVDRCMFQRMTTLILKRVQASMLFH